MYSNDPYYLLGNALYFILKKGELEKINHTKFFKILKSQIPKNKRLNITFIQIKNLIKIKASPEIALEQLEFYKKKYTMNFTDENKTTFKRFTLKFISFLAQKKNIHQVQKAYNMMT